MFGLMSPAGSAARLNTFIFHRVLTEPDPLFPTELDARRFDHLMGCLARWFQVLPLEEAVRRLAEGTLPSRAATITFDDGYADNWTNAAPILKRHCLHATFFIATGFLDGGRMWNDSLIEAIRRSPFDRLVVQDLGPELAGLAELDLGSWASKRQAVDQLIAKVKYLGPARRLELVGAIVQRSGASMPDDLMLTSEQLQELHQSGMGIGAHTVNHPILAQLPDEEAEAEMHGSKHALELLLDTRIGLFAYPNGKPGEDYSSRSVEIARRVGFDAAVATSWGVAHGGTDLFQIPRYTPWNLESWKVGARLLQNLKRTEVNLRSA